MRGRSLYSTEESTDIDSCDIEVLGASHDFGDEESHDVRDGGGGVLGNVLSLDEGESMGWRDTFGSAEVKGYPPAPLSIAAAAADWPRAADDVDTLTAEAAERRRRHRGKEKIHPLHADLVATGVDDVEPLHFLLHLLERADFTLTEQRLVLRELRRVDYVEGEFICRQGDVSDFMAVIARGSVVVRHGGMDVMRLYAGDHFGEVPLLTRETRVADVVASSEVTSVLKLPFERFEALLREHPALRPLMNALRHKVVERLEMRRRMAGQQAMARCVYVSEKTVYREMNTVELGRTRTASGMTRSVINEYIVVCELGRGSHGKVFLVEEQNSGEQYALKVVSRSHLRRQNALLYATKDEEDAASRRVVREIEVMQRLVHANVVRLEAVIDDPAVDELYIVEGESVRLYTVTFHANLAHSLTRSP